MKSPKLVKMAIFTGQLLVEMSSMEGRRISLEPWDGKKTAPQPSGITFKN
jgi:hypothetical protein